MNKSNLTFIDYVDLKTEYLKHHDNCANILSKLIYIKKEHSFQKKSALDNQLNNLLLLDNRAEAKDIFYFECLQLAFATNDIFYFQEAKAYFNDDERFINLSWKFFLAHSFSHKLGQVCSIFAMNAMHREGQWYSLFKYSKYKKTIKQFLYDHLKSNDLYQNTLSHIYEFDKKIYEDKILPVLLTLTHNQYCNFSYFSKFLDNKDYLKKDPAFIMELINASIDGVFNEPNNVKFIKNILLNYDKPLDYFQIWEQFNLLDVHRKALLKKEQIDTLIFNKKLNQTLEIKPSTIRHKI